MTFGFGFWIKNQISELGDSDQKSQAENLSTAAPTKPGITYESLTQGLIAYYPFNGNAMDESGNGNDGEVKGATLAVDRHGGKKIRPISLSAVKVWVITSKYPTRPTFMNLR